MQMPENGVAIKGLGALRRQKETKRKKCSQTRTQQAPTAWRFQDPPVFEQSHILFFRLRWVQNLMIFSWTANFAGLGVERVQQQPQITLALHQRKFQRSRACNAIFYTKYLNDKKVPYNKKTCLLEPNNMARPEGFEPPTLCSGGTRSIHLSYGRIPNLLELSHCITFSSSLP